MTDQTARIDDGRYRGKHVLIIGSGSDLDGRAMQAAIDGGDFDLVARVNKVYGAPEDVGTRTDVLFTRWYSWLDNKAWVPDSVASSATIVVLNQHIGYSKTEYEWLCARIGHNAASAGAQAVDYFLNRGAAKVSIIGFGCRGGKFNRDKVYSVANTAHVPTRLTTEEGKDVNPTYDWHAERAWELSESRVTFL